MPPGGSAHWVGAPTGATAHGWECASATDQQRPALASRKHISTNQPTSHRVTPTSYINLHHKHICSKQHVRNGRIVRPHLKPRHRSLNIPSVYDPFEVLSSHLLCRHTHRLEIVPMQSWGKVSQCKQRVFMAIHK